mgnify:CR=1 FL=1
MKVSFCCPTLTEPYPQFLDAMRREVPVLDAAGIEHGMTFEVGCPYISHARATMLRRAMDEKPDVFVFLDHDLSWPAGELLKLIQTPGDVVCGTYRFKKDEEQYMGSWRTDDEKYPIQRDDGCIRGEWIPAGFLKVTAAAVARIMEAYPELVYGDKDRPAVDLFNHGAHEGIWFGEDYAFSRRWNDCGGEIWINPDLTLTHHRGDGRDFPGNFLGYLRRLPGGDLAEAA